MARRTQVFQLLPWSGGINTSVDSGVIPAGDLVTADNVIYSNNGIKQKREGFTDYDALSDIPAITHRSSSGTTRTLVFASAVTSSTIDALVAGEGITVAGASGTETTSYAITAGTVATIGTTTVTNDTITYTASGSLTEGSTATSTMTIVRAYPIVHIKDYWRYNGSQMAQLVIAVTSQPKVFRYDSSGRRKEIALAAGADARSGTALRVNSVVFNNYLVIAQERVGNEPLKYNTEADSGELTDLSATAPDFSLCATYLSRIWTNDKTNRDRLHYSATGSLSSWSGADDSGALDIRPGDGDPEGITAIFPFKGRLFVAKKNKLYQVVGNSPETFQVLDVSEGLGIEAHGAVAAVDQDDVLYVSSKGVHSVATTSNYGDFQASFLSNEIQPTFNDWEQPRLKYTQATYIPILNAVAFSVASESTTAQDAVWLYFVNVKKWARWPDISCQALGTVLLDSKSTLFIGTATGKLIRTQNGTYTDYTATGIIYRLVTGSIYPDNSPITVKMFKNLTIFFRPRGDFNFAVRAKIDNHSEQAFAFSASLQSDELDVDFILGQSTLGGVAQFAPFTANMDGMGRGIVLTMEQTGQEEQVDVYGFSITYESADIAQETSIDPGSGETV